MARQAVPRAVAENQDNRLRRLDRRPDETSAGAHHEGYDDQSSRAAPLERMEPEGRFYPPQTDDRPSFVPSVVRERLIPSGMHRHTRTRLVAEGNAMSPRRAKVITMPVRITPDMEVIKKIANELSKKALREALAKPR